MNPEDYIEVKPENLAEAVAALKSNDIRYSSADPKAYTSPADHILEKTGRPISSYLPNRFGLKGTVIPRATRLGGSMGFNPHTRPQTVNIINMDGNNSSSYSVDFSQINNGEIKTLCENKNYNQVLDIEDVRAEADNVFRQLVGRQHETEVPEKRAEYSSRPEERLPPPGLPRGTYVVPKAATGGGQIIPKTREQWASVNQKPQMTKQVISPPQHRVTFEIEGVGQVSSDYHYAEHDGDFLILANDTTYNGATRFRPSRMNMPILVEVERLGRVFEVMSAGIQFQIANLEICVLLINTSVDRNQETEVIY